MSWIRFCSNMAIVAVLTVTAAAMHGNMRHRWGTSTAAGEAAARLQAFPGDFGDWHMVSARDLDEISRNQLECLGAMDRVYANGKTGEKVSLLFILGPTGPTAAHTPDVCIGQRDFTALDDRRERPVGDGSDRFWNERFKSKNIHGELLSVSWAWNADGRWIAAKDARYTFAGTPFLYKAQVTCEGDVDGGQRFLADFVPVAAKYVVPGINH